MFPQHAIHNMIENIYEVIDDAECCKYEYYNMTYILSF